MVQAITFYGSRRQNETQAEETEAQGSGVL